MKKLLLSLILLILPISMCMAEIETVRPSWNVTIERPLSYVIINEDFHKDCTVIIKASDVQVLGDDFVTVKVIDKNKKQIYKKKFKRHHLYVYSNGAIQVSNGTALVSCIFARDEDDFLFRRFGGKIAEKGIY